MKNWEYDPIPRYYFFLGDEAVAEIVFDGFGSAVCNDFSPDGEIWRALAHDELLGRFSNLQDAQKAVHARVMNRGLSLV